jgi:hypothetical protein
MSTNFSPFLFILFPFFNISLIFRSYNKNKQLDRNQSLLNIEDLAMKLHTIFNTKYALGLVLISSLLFSQAGYALIEGPAPDPNLSALKPELKLPATFTLTFTRTTTLDKIEAINPLTVTGVPAANLKIDETLNHSTCKTTNLPANSPIPVPCTLTIIYTNANATTGLSEKGSFRLSRNGGGTYPAVISFNILWQPVAGGFGDLTSTNPLSPQMFLVGAPSDFSYKFNGKKAGSTFTEVISKEGAAFSASGATFVMDTSAQSTCLKPETVGNCEVYFKYTHPNAKFGLPYPGSFRLKDNKGVIYPAEDKPPLAFGVTWKAPDFKAISTDATASVSIDSIDPSVDLKYTLRLSGDAGVGAAFEQVLKNVSLAMPDAPNPGTIAISSTTCTRIVHPGETCDLIVKYTARPNSPDDRTIVPGEVKGQFQLKFAGMDELFPGTNPFFTFTVKRIKPKNVLLPEVPYDKTIDISKPAAVATLSYQLINETNAPVTFPSTIYHNVANPADPGNVKFTKLDGSAVDPKISGTLGVSSTTSPRPCTTAVAAGNDCILNLDYVPPVNPVPIDLRGTFALSVLIPGRPAVPATPNTPGSPAIPDSYAPRYITSFIVHHALPGFKITRNKLEKSYDPAPATPEPTVTFIYDLENQGAFDSQLAATPFTYKLLRNGKDFQHELPPLTPAKIAAKLGTLALQPSSEQSTCLKNVPGRNGTPDTNTCKLQVIYTPPTDPKLAFGDTIEAEFQVGLGSNQPFPAGDDRFKFTINVKKKPIVLAVGSNGTVLLSSYTGLKGDWTRITNGITPTDMLNGVAQSNTGNKPIVIVGSNEDSTQGVVYVNPNGKGDIWTKESLPAKTPRLNGVAYGIDPETGTKVFIAVGDEGTVCRSTSSTAPNPEGRGWTCTKLPNIEVPLLSIANNDTSWVLVGESSFIFYKRLSNKSWTRGNMAGYSTLTSVAWNGSLWIASSLNTPFIFVSKNQGVSWTSESYTLDIPKYPEPLWAVSCEQKTKACLLLGRYGTGVLRNETGQYAPFASNMEKVQSFWTGVWTGDEWMVGGTKTLAMDSGAGSGNQHALLSVGKLEGTDILSLIVLLPN